MLFAWEYYLLVTLFSGCVGSAWPVVARAPLARLRPMPKPAPRPTSSATIPVITAGMMGEPLCGVVAADDVPVVVVGFAVTPVVALVPLGLTVKVNAPSSG